MRRHVSLVSLASDKSWIMRGLGLGLGLGGGNDGARVDVLYMTGEKRGLDGCPVFEPATNRVWMLCVRLGGRG